MDDQPSDGRPTGFGGAVRPAPDGSVNGLTG